MTKIYAARDTTMTHHEIPVQVTAWVDEGVAELVAALNGVPDVMTLDSCQEGRDGRARVSFCTHDPAMIYDTLGHIARVLADNARGSVTLSLWWGADDAPPVADLHCPPGLVSAVAGALRSSAARKTL